MIHYDILMEKYKFVKNILIESNTYYKAIIIGFTDDFYHE